MFREKYNEYNKHIVPSEKLLQHTIDLVQKDKKMKSNYGIGKNVAVAACMILVVGVTTITIDAATGGAIRKALGLEEIPMRDNIIIYDDANEIHTVYKDENGDYFLQAGKEGNDGSWTMMIDPVNPLFAINIEISENKKYGWSMEVYDYMSDEDTSWAIYAGLTDLLRSETDKDAVIEKLTECVKELDNEYYKAGINMAIDDFKNNENNLIEEYLVDYYDEDSQTEMVDVAWIKINLDEVEPNEKEVSQEIETISVAGYKMKFKVVISKNYASEIIPII